MWWTPLLLVGCPWVGETALDQVRDPDGDGVVSCAFASPPCDCDDTDAAIGAGAPQDWYPDTDGDGFGASDPVEACVAPVGHVAQSGDCDDSEAQIAPGATERCNGLDDDCDGVADQADGPLLGSVTCYPDGDGDGFGDDGQPVEVCACGPDQVEVGGDCDDTDALLHPDTEWFVDADGDGVGGPLLATVACEGPDGTATTRDDCDDAHPEVYPGQPDDPPFDGLDSDCRGGTDLDADGDGDPDLFEAPAPGDPWPTASTPRLPGCDGPIVPVSGGGRALQDALDDAKDDATFLVAFDPAGDNDYDAVVLQREACIVGDPGVRIVSTLDEVPAVYVTRASHVLLEGLELAAPVGLKIDKSILDPHTSMSRVRHEGGRLLLQQRIEEGKESEARHDLHHVEVLDGEEVAEANGLLVARHLTLRGLISTTVMLAGDVLDLDIVGLDGEDLATPRAVLLGTGDRIWVSDVLVDHLVGGVVEAVLLVDEAEVDLHDIEVRNASYAGSLLDVSGVSDIKGRLGTVRASGLDVDYEGAGLQGNVPAVSIYEVTSATVHDSVVTASAGQGIEVTADTATVEHLVIASSSVGLSTDAEVVSRITVKSNICVSGRGAEVTQLEHAYLIACSNTGHLMGPNVSEVSAANASCDLVTFALPLGRASWDLRPHPRNPSYTGAWAPGFVGDTLDPGSGLDRGAYTGSSALVAELHDADGDGMYDTWEQAHGIDDPLADPDNDGLDNATEFQGKALGGFSTDPTDPDTDDDGVLDGDDCDPLNRFRSADCDDLGACPQ